MTFASVSDLSRHLMIRRHSSQIRSDLDRLTGMLASGQKADLPASLGGNLKPFNAVQTNLSRLDGWDLAGKSLRSQMEAMQSAMTSMRSLGASAANAFLHAKGANQVALAGREAVTTLEGLLGHLNTRVGEEWVFAGVTSDGPAVATADDLLSHLSTMVVGLTTPEEVADTVLDWMQDPSGFAAFVYTGDTAAPPVTLSAQDQLAHGITAADPGFALLIGATAFGALLDRGLFAGNLGARDETAKIATELLLGSAQDGVHLAARLGQDQARLDRIMTRNAAERSALTIERNDTLRSDPEETASELSATALQLEILYEMTARLSSLTLLNALR